MEFEFDKEIDALLRETAQGEAAFAAGNSTPKIQNSKFAHLDADEISAFAENALPEKSRQKYVFHLADCAKCRKNLSNLILLNTETPSETIHAEEKKQIVLTPIPWYRKLFLFPNLAYTLGALIVVFSGVAVFTVLQSVSNKQSFEMSQVSEKQPNGKGMSSDGDSLPMRETYSSNSMSSNTAAMNTASNSMTMANSATSATPAAPVLMANSNIAVRDESDKMLKTEPSKAAKPLSETSDLTLSESQNVAGAPPPPAPKENNLQENELAKQQQNQTQNPIIAQNQTTIMPDSRNVQRAPSATLRADNKAKKLEESKDDAREKSTETIVAGGKTFKRQNNVWYDSIYKGQTTTNVTRGTKEYKKLDSGLRGIAENLGGTVVIVWKEKAYRIQ